MDQELSKRTLTLERTFNAPIQLVWQAWTQPEHIIQWWGPPGIETKIVEHNFKIGGTWKFTMLMPDGNEFITEGVYQEIIEEQVIISTADFRPMTEGVEIQALFEPRGDHTLFTFNVIHPSEEYCRQQEEMGFYNGWGSTFDRLSELLQQEKAAV